MNKCLMEIDRNKDFTWAEKLAYLGYRFMDKSQTGCPVLHLFEPGLYIREMYIPKETLFIGRPHLLGHRCELVEGKILLIEEHKKTIKKAPDSLQSIPGYQMVLFSMTGVRGRTYHANPLELRDAEVLEDSIFASAAALLILGQQVSDRIHRDGREVISAEELLV